jgi:hypothetical protein
MSTTIKVFKSVSKSGIFAFVNTKNKRVDVRASLTIGKAIQMIVDDAVKGVLVPRKLQKAILNDKVEIVVLEELPTRTEQNLRLGYWVKEWESKGYASYGKRKKAVPSYKIIKDLVVKPGEEFHFGVHVILKVGKQKILLGIFDTIENADKFIETNYGDGFKRLVYAK